MLICEMAAFYRTKGISLLQARANLYEKYGVYLHVQKSFTCEGASGMQRMDEIMTNLRENVPQEIGGLNVISFDDYLASTSKDMILNTITKIQLPKSNVLTFTLEKGASIIFRPSGTEPKIKAYYTTIGETREVAEKLEAEMSDDFKRIIGF